LLRPPTARADPPAPAPAPAAAAASSSSSPAAASATPPAPPDADDTARAREAFVQGTAFVHQAQWAEALSAFERSAKLRPHAVTTYNIGACQRALGQYTLARATLRAALARNEQAGGGELPDGVVAEIEAYTRQIDSLLAVADVTLDPPGAAIAVDGRPLAVDPSAAPSAGAAPVLVAGVRPPGPGEPPPAARFVLVLDPGAHVMTLSRKGYADAVVNRTMLPGSRTTLALALDRLPATLHIVSDPPGAIVTVDGDDVGPAPVDVLRPAGSYRVVVRKAGFVTYEAQVPAQAGQEVDLHAKLPEQHTPLTKRWWFWTAAGVVVAGAAAGTYALTRTPPTPTRPPPDCGGLGWCVQAQ
jgi:hypothetical protein